MTGEFSEGFRFIDDEARSNRRVPIDIYVNKVINGVPHLARTRDISRNGVFLHKLLEPTAPDGSRIDLEFMLPGTDDVIWTEVEVVRDDTPGGMGLRFLELGERDSSRIREFVESSSIC